MKRCPTCNRTFTDRNLSFCIDDGTPLIEVEFPAAEVTQVSPAHGQGPSSKPGDQNPPAYQPPRSYSPPGTPPVQSKRRVWPWVLGILALLLLLVVGMGIAAIYLVPKMIRESANDNTRVNVNRNDRSNSNRNSNTLEKKSNDNTTTNEWTSPPTDEQQVLVQLTELEHEWTVANINADKKKLDHILADDYVGEDAQGETHGKAEYLRTVERDTSIQKWDFEELKVELNGDRASLSGILRLQINDKPAAFRFTDKFVWRDGRWQAVGSEVTPLKTEKGVPV